MRRLVTWVLMVVSAASWVIHGAATAGVHRASQPDATLASVAGWPATARLVQDAGLTLTTAELPRHILKAVLVDVDADGDADLVANVGSLDLGVWINDGSGRLTRARAVSTPAEWAPLPPVPSFEGKTTRLDVTLPDGGAWSTPPPIRAGPAPRLRTQVITATDHRVAAHVSPVSSPRAPPLA